VGLAALGAVLVHSVLVEAVEEVMPLLLLLLQLQLPRLEVVVATLEAGGGPSPLVGARHGALRLY